MERTTRHPMGEARTDEELVAATLAGDREALGVIYDRYADRVHTMCAHLLSDRDEAADVCGEVFLTAAERLGQLRDPARLKAWLFAIARHQVYLRTRRRRRIELTEEVEDVMPTTSGADELADAAMGAGELALVIREASAGLDQADRTVLELQLQGLEGQDLADAMGVSATNAYQASHRMKGRLERSLGALLVARQGRADCPDLDRVLAGWDGGFSVLWRKRVARHVDGCEVCERRRKLVPVLLLDGVAAAAPVAAVPISVRSRVLEEAVVGGGAGAPSGPAWRSDGFPPADGGGRRRGAALVAAAAAVLLLVLGGVALLGGGPEEVRAGPARSAGARPTSASSTTTTEAPEDPAATTTVPAGGPGAGGDPSATTVPTVPVEPGTTAPPGPDPLGDPQDVPPGTTPPPVTTLPPLRDTTPPAVVLGGPSTLYWKGAVDLCGPNAVFSASTPGADDVASVRLVWSSGAGSGQTSMIRIAGSWAATLTPPAGATSISVHAVAVDRSGNEGRSATRAVTGQDCPVPG